MKRYFIDLFAGCGGLSYGLELAGFEPLLYNEINHSALSSYIYNREQSGKSMPIIIKDAKDLTEDVIDGLKGNWAKEKIKDIDLVMGGPPCWG